MALRSEIEQDEKVIENGTLEKADAINVQGAGQSADQDVNAKEYDKASVAPVGRQSDFGWTDEEPEAKQVQTEQVTTQNVPTQDVETPQASVENAERSNVPQPDTAQPDAAQPDAVQPDAAQPDAAQPDAEERAAQADPDSHRGSVIFGQELDDAPAEQPAPAGSDAMSDQLAQVDRDADAVTNPRAEDVSNQPEVRQEQERVNSEEMASLGEKSPPNVGSQERERSTGREA